MDLDQALVIEIRAEARAQGVRIADLAIAACRSLVAMNRYLSPKPEKRRPMNTEDVERIATRLALKPSELYERAEARLARNHPPMEGLSP
jgi:hypothetical protein